ncbi:MAG: hydrogenase maturation protease [Anaerolineales bacterium]
MTMRTLIIGIGNPIRGDDGLGWEAIRQLSQQIDDPQVELLTCQQLTMDLIEYLERVDCVYFIDARIGEPAGELKYFPIEPDTCLQTAVSHFFDPRNLMAAAQALYGHHPVGGLFSVNAHSFDFTEELTPPVQAALPGLVAAVRAALEGNPLEGLASPNLMVTAWGC